MASNALTPIVYQLQQSLREVDLRSFDLQGLFSSIDIKVVAWVALAVVAFFFVLDLFAKSSYAPYGRSLALSAASAWEANKDYLGLGEATRGSRSLEPLTEVLDALAAATKKWGDVQGNVLGNRQSL